MRHFGGLRAALAAAAFAAPSGLLAAAGGPNLTVSSASVSVAKIRYSDSVRIHYRIENVGTEPAPGSVATIASDGSRVAKKSVAALAAGAGRDYVTTLSGKALGRGTHSIVIKADGTAAVGESDEKDNSLSLKVKVVKDPPPDAASKVDWAFHKRNPSEPSAVYLETSEKSKRSVKTFKAGEKIYVQIGFRNALGGEADGTVSVKAELNNGGSHSWTWKNLKRKATAYIADGLRAPEMLQNLAPGRYTLTVTLDDSDGWREKDEGNNVKTISFTVEGPPEIIAADEYVCALMEPVSWAVSGEGTVTCAGLPEGLVYAGGVIKGRAVKTGAYKVAFVAKNAAGTAKKKVVVRVGDPGFDVDVEAYADGGAAARVASGGTLPLYIGVEQKLTIAARPGKSGVAKAAAAVSVSELPKGLSYANGVISGVPAKAGTSKITVRCKNALGWKKSFSFKLKILELPEFATGVFNGGSEGGDDGGFTTPNQTTFLVSSKGKIAGKIYLPSAVWSVKASNFAKVEEYDDGQKAFVAHLDLTNGRQVTKISLRITNEADGVLARGCAVCDLFEARQNMWTESILWRGWARLLEGRTFRVADGSLTPVSAGMPNSLKIKFEEDGIATAKAKGGDNVFSCSVVLVPTAMSATSLDGLIYCRFAPDDDIDFGGFAGVAALSVSSNISAE